MTSTRITSLNEAAYPFCASNVVTLNYCFHKVLFLVWKESGFGC